MLRSKLRFTAFHQKQASWSARAYITLGFLALIAIFLVWYGGLVQTDMVFFLLFLGVILLGRTRAFLRDWTPFIALLFAWQMLRGYADNVASSLGLPLHNADLIATERWLFRGYLPSTILQQKFYRPGEIHWYDIVATSFWAFHFVLPILFAFLLWIRSRRLFQSFTSALLVLSLAGFITYILFPAVPPWLASTQEYGALISPIALIRISVIEQMHYGSSISFIVQTANPDLVAAMPSLHSAYPALVLFFTLTYWRRVAPLAALYCCGIWISVVYLGDHYVIDAVAGITYAALSLALVILIRRFFLQREAIGRRKEHKEKQGEHVVLIEQ